MAAEADEKVKNRNQFDPLTGLLRETFFYAWVQDKLPSLEGQWCMVEVDIEHCKLFQEWNGEEKTRSLFAQIGSILNAYAQQFDALAGFGDRIAGKEVDYLESMTITC